MRSLPGTVAVIGAGASSHYGLPTGPMLLQKIQDLLREPTPLLQAVIQDRGFRGNEVRDLLFMLNYEGFRTIDECLRKTSPRLRAFGKILISHVLLHAERSFVRAPVQQFERDWCTPLVRRMAAASAEARGQFGIVTFNYDRVFEYHVARHLVSGAILRDEDVAEGSFPFVEIQHLHGSLGHARAHRNWCIGHFDEEVTPGKLREAAEGISIVAEPESELAFVRAREMILGAQRLIFLGFGFDMTNLGRLLRASEDTPLPRLQLKAAFSTCRDIDATTRTQVEAALGSAVRWLDAPTQDGVDAMEVLGDPFLFPAPAA